MNKELNMCISVADEIIKKFGKDIPASELPEEERNVLLIINSTGVHDNGGFKYLFSIDLPGDEDFEFLKKAFEAIDCIKCSNILSNAINIIPNMNKRKKWIKTTSTETWRTLNRMLWDESDNILKNLYLYVINNKLNLKYNVE